MSLPLQGETPSRKWPWVLLALFYCFSATALFTLWRLPHEEILEQATAVLEHESGIQSEWDSSGNGWFGSIYAENLRLLIPDEAQAGLMSLEKVQVGANWSSFLTSRPGGWLSIVLPNQDELQGSVRLSNWKGGQVQSFSVESDGLSLDQFSDLPRVGRASGQMSLLADWQMPDTDPQSWSGSVNLELQSASFSSISLGSLSLEELPLGNLNLLAEIEPGTGRLVLQTAQIGGAQVELVATGELRLSNRWQSSALDMNLRLRLTGQMESNYTELLELMQYRRDNEGWFPMKIQGTLGRPVLRAGP